MFGKVTFYQRTRLPKSQVALKAAKAERAPLKGAVAQAEQSLVQRISSSVLDETSEVVSSLRLHSVFFRHAGCVESSQSRASASEGRSCSSSVAHELILSSEYVF